MCARASMDEVCQNIIVCNLAHERSVEVVRLSVNHHRHHRNKTVLSCVPSVPLVFHIYLRRLPHSRYSSAVIAFSLAMTSPAFGPESVDLGHSAAAMLHDGFLSGLFF